MPLSHSKAKAVYDDDFIYHCQHQQKTTCTIPSHFKFDKKFITLVEQKSHLESICK